MSTNFATIQSSEDLTEKVLFSVNNSYLKMKHLNQKNHISYSILNFFDYIPLVSNVSGVTRGVFGLIETLFGIPAFPIQLLGRAIYQKNEKGHSSFLFNKGLANIVRGHIAQMPLIGNLTLYIYDYSPNLKSDFQSAFGINN